MNVGKNGDFASGGNSGAGAGGGAAAARERGPRAFWARNREALTAMVAVAIFYGVLFALGVTCPIKALTGVSCPGCGMTRAWLSLLRGDLAAAWDYHPLFALPAIALPFYFARRKIPRTCRALAVIALALMIAVYILRMFDPACEVVVFRPSESLIARAARYLQNLRT